jgi:NADH:ubiquinone oxidoreductase subunit E
MVVGYSPVSDERSSSAEVSDKPIEIVICLGSSCFARGNAETLRTVKTYLEQCAVAAKLCTRGALCQRECAKGPSIVVDGIQHNHVKPDYAIELIEQAIRQRGW